MGVYAGKHTDILQILGCNTKKLYNRKQISIQVHLVSATMDYISGRKRVERERERSKKRESQRRKEKEKIKRERERMCVCVREREREREREIKRSLTRVCGPRLDLDGRPAPDVLLHLGHPLPRHLVRVVGGTHCDLVQNTALALQLLSTSTEGQTTQGSVCEIHSVALLLMYTAYVQI